MINPTLDRVGQLLNEAHKLLNDYPHLQDAVEIICEEIDQQLDYEDEITAHQG